MTSSLKLALASAGLAASLVACGRETTASRDLPPPGTTSTIPDTHPAATGTSTTFSLTIPAKPAASGPEHFVSPSAVSVAIAVYDSMHATLLASIAQDITAGSPNCSAGSPVICNIPINALGAGDYTMDIGLYDGAVSGSTPTGTELSANLAYPFTVLAGTSNNVGITLQGIPADVSIVPSSNEDVQGDESGGFDLYGFYKADGTTIYPRQFNVFALDADGNVIVGPGAPAVTLTSSATSTLSNGVPAAGNPNLLTVTPVTYTASAALQMTATATPSTVDGSNSGASPVTRTVAVRIPYVNAPRVYVVDLLDNEVGAVNIADEWGNPVAHTGLFPDLDGASGAAFDPILNRLYVVNQYGSTVTAYDLDGNELTLTGNSDEPFPNLDQPLAITFDQSKQRLIVTNTGSAPTVYDEAGNQLTVSGTWMEKEASPVCLAYGVLADPNNNLVYVTDADQGAPACGAGGAGKVEAYDTNGNAQFSWEAGDGVAGLAQDPVSHWLYVSDDSLSINAYDEQGHLIPGILAQDNSGTAFPNANGAFGLAFSPGNRYLYVANYSGDTVTVYDRQGNQINTSGSLFQANQTNGPVGIVVVP